MYIHTLTSDDHWFLEKGRIDSISRSPFTIGDRVVVCDKQHVMLADYYEGECPTCHSCITVPFSCMNVEPGTLRIYEGECPECHREARIIFRQHGIRNPFIGKCPECNKVIRVMDDFFIAQAHKLRFRKHISRLNTALHWTLGLLAAFVLVLIFTGEISNDNLTEYAVTVIFPRTQSICIGLKSFCVSEKFNDNFLLANWLLIARNSVLLTHMEAEIMLLVSGTKIIALRAWTQIQSVLFKTQLLLKLCSGQTSVLIERIIVWVNELYDKMIVLLRRNIG